MIHYNGKTSASSGRVACKAASPQATGDRWHVVDCWDCKRSLIGLPVVWEASSGTLRGTVDQVDGRQVTVQWADVSGSGFGTERLSFFELDNEWITA